MFCEGTEGGSALSPEITKAFAREMLATYIGWREGKELKGQSNREIFSGLARILKKAGSGGGWEEESPGRKKWKMMVE